MELNERQYQYIEADAVLSLLEGRLWMSLRELSEEMVVRRGASRSDYRAAMAALHRLRLIESFPGTAETVALTGEGEKALAVGGFLREAEHGGLVPPLNLLPSCALARPAPCGFVSFFHND